MSLVWTISFDAERVSENLDEVADRFVNARPAFRKVMEMAEADEIKHFNNLRGRYVLTGATRASLTQEAAPGAIRKLHRDGGGIEFGSAVPHAKYLTRVPKKRDSGEVRKQPPLKGKSAVLILTKATRKAAAQVILDYIVEPVE